MKDEKLISEIRRMQELAGILTENTLNESDWYHVKKWDEAGQKYVNHLGGNIDVLKEQPKFKIKDVVKVKAFDKEYIAQIIIIQVNYDTKEILYGVRLFTAPEYEQGSTMLYKLEPDEIIEKITDIPDNIKKNSKFEK